MIHIEPLKWVELREGLNLDKDIVYLLFPNVSLVYQNCVGWMRSQVVSGITEQKTMQEFARRLCPNPQSRLLVEEQKIVMHKIY